MGSGGCEPFRRPPRGAGEDVAVARQRVAPACEPHSVEFRELLEPEVAGANAVPEIGTVERDHGIAVAVRGRF